MTSDRLILAVAGFYPDSVGGAERQARILSEALGRLGVDVTLVAPTVSPDAPLIEPTSFGRIERRRVRHYPSAGGKHLAAFIGWTLWFRNRFGKGADAGTPIYCFHARLHALGPALAALAGGAPLMIKLGGGGEASDFAALREKKFFYGYWVQDFLLKRTACFVANSGQIDDDLRALGVPATAIAAFPNGVVLPPMETVQQTLAARTGDRFIFSGRMVADKRISVLHEAAMSLAQAPRRPRMVFLGDGPERDRLAALPGSRSDPEFFAFPGFVDDVYGALGEADFFVSASLREGQSNALLEAMSAGVIPIVCNASGVAEIVEHGRTGFIVDQSEPEAFAEAMRHALALEPERRREIALAARAFAQTNIGIDAIAARTLGIVRSLASTRKRP